MIGRRQVHLERVDSTNEEAFRLLDEVGPAEAEGTVITADLQEHGRGSRGHSWSAPPEQALLLSTILRLATGTPPQVLSLLGGVAVWRLLRETTPLVARLKWPNDVLVEERKIAGVLAEIRSRHPLMAVLGIGLNLLQPEESLRAAGLPGATSLAAHGLRMAPREAAARLTTILDELYGPLREGRTEPLTLLWDTALALRGRPVEVVHRGRSHFGRLVGVTATAAIRLDVPGQGVLCLAGEHVISLRPLQGSGGCADSGPPVPPAGG
ncbi:MAG: biotin--[acetyl-CoA-carboxylase] ligase [Planctomycetota bacterium]